MFLVRRTDAPATYNRNPTDAGRFTVAMNPFPLAQLRQVVGGRPLTHLPDGDPYIRAVCTDSRKLDGGCLFVAIKGDNHDGHDFVPRLKGVPGSGQVIAVLVDRECGPYPAGVFVLLVPSTRAAMGRLASHLRGQFTGSVIAVGGSNGKTTTKHLIAAAMGPRLSGSTSPKSFNNDIGVPLTIFGHAPNSDYLVLEMGTNHHGELKVLSDMARPDIAVITSISEEHLEGLGDLAGVRREEASIISGLDPKGLLVANGDDPDFLPHIATFPGRKITFGFGTSNDLFASDVRLGPDGVRFNLNNSRREVFVPIQGRHTASNALAAIAVARRLGRAEDEIIESLATARGPEMRQQLLTADGVTILNDAYNSNPASARAALDTLLNLSPQPGGRRIAVIGDMRELGTSSEYHHTQLGLHLAGLNLDEVLLVGEQSRATLAAAVSAGTRPAWFPTPADAAPTLRALLKHGDLLLLKASRGIQLETLLPELQLPTLTKRAAG
jgi:UDP-N-acetylmuramoyl-tripeptide--D-alanyl-D-alanine ligase